MKSILYLTAATALLSGTAICTPAFAQSVDKNEKNKQGEGGNKSEDIIVEGHYSTVPTSASSASKSDLLILDTPATITVINRELIDSQLAVDLQDVIRNTSGLNQAGNNYGVGDFLQSRGLPVSYAYDGLYGGAGIGPSSYSPTRSLTNVERIEILQGANATLYGAGSAGGIINLIEKKPLYNEAYNVELRAGAFDTYGAVLDATGPINDILAYRVVGGLHRSQGFRNLSNDKNELYGSLSARFSERNNLTLSVGYLDDSVQVDSNGYPVRIFNPDSTTPAGISAENVTPENLPNGATPGLQLTDAQIATLAGSLAKGDGINPFDLKGASLISPLARPNEGEELRVKLRWEWEPIDGLQIVPSVQYRTYKSNYVRHTGAFNYVYWRRNGIINQSPRAPLVEDGVIYPFALRRQEYRLQNVKEKSWDNFIDVKYKGNILGMDSQFLLTAYYQKIDVNLYGASLYDRDDRRSSENPVPYIYDIRDPNFPSGRFEDYDYFVSTNYDKTIISKGIGFQNITYIAPWLIGRFGIGVNGIKQDFDNGPTETTPDREPIDQSDSGMVYNVGLTVKPVDWFAGFIAYGKGRTSYSFEGTLNGTSDRPDSESTNFELGAKLQSRDGNIAFGATYFETKRTNLRYNNPLFEDNLGDPNYNVDVPEYFYDGEDRTRGVSVDLNLLVLNGLFINANGTWQSARNRNDPNSSTYNTKQKGTPDFFASVYGVYKIPAEIAGGKVSVSLGYEFQDKRTIDSSAFGLPNAVLPKQGVWDAGLEYASIDGPWSLKLQLRNMTDTLAYSKAQFLGGLPTAPINVNAVLRVKF